MSTVTEWYFDIQDIGLVEGDLIEFDRGAYSHWAIYNGNEEVVHFHMVDNSREVGIDTLHEFVPGIVTKDDFKTVQGESRFRLNNKPDFEKPPREPKAVKEVIEGLLEKKGIYYCLGLFNCEHFVTFVKFAEARSTQIETITNRLSVSLGISEILRLQQYCNALSTEQWEVNLRAPNPQHFLPEKVKFLLTSNWTMEQLGI